jgi:hypothetical protein
MKTFEQFLLEVAAGISELQSNNMYIVFRPDSGNIQKAIEEPDTRVLFQLMQRPQKYLGEIELDLPHIDNKPYYGFQVYAIHSDVHVKGFGPLLYDLGMEYASLHGMSVVSAEGLAAMLKTKGVEYERGSTTASAANIWKGYSKRQDVKRNYGGPGFNHQNHLTRPVNKKVDKLHQLSNLKLIVDPKGNPIDFTPFA